MERRSGERERVVLIAAGAVALGVHAGLASDQLRDWAPLGASFIAAAVVLTVGVAWVAAGCGHCEQVTAGLALLFAALILGYLATRLFALPPLDPDREPVDALGTVTTAVETAGLLVALRLSRRHPFPSPPGGRP
jgi:hypothetical protein